MWELDYKESWALRNWCFWTVVLEKTLESPLDCKEIQPVYPKGKSVLNIHWKDWCWSWISNTLATWCEELTNLKRPWCWERLRAGGEGNDRGWNGWMASPTWWTWVWVNSGSWWWTGRPGVLRFMGSQSQTQLSDWTELNSFSNVFLCSQVFPCGSADKESACNSGDLGSIPGLGRAPGEGKGYPLQYSGLENSMDGVAKSWTWLSDSLSLSLLF